MIALRKNVQHLTKPILPVFTKNGTVGLELERDALKLVQLKNNGNGIQLIAGGSDSLPPDISPYTASWQHWAIEAISRITEDGKFKSRDVVAVIPTGNMFIEHIKTPRISDTTLKGKRNLSPNNDKLKQAVVSKIKHKLPFGAENAILRYIPTEDDSLLVMAADRSEIDKNLAIYENANLHIKAIATWPAALANTYTAFFGRRQSDAQVVVLLLEIEQNWTKLVICRGRNLLFARLIPIGITQLTDNSGHQAGQEQDGDSDVGAESATAQSEENITRLVLELNSCRRHFTSIHKRAHIERLIFLSGQVIDRSICQRIAKQLEIPAQVGDCLAAVEIQNPQQVGIDRRGCQLNWATAFGLSLS
ncbi:MAG: pilus assembly protein PilM [Sedimentisphaerales bacterium]|nr:pilus assembly protein PilM [Sedimentisphaerales bacterium]